MYCFNPLFLVRSAAVSLAVLLATVPCRAQVAGEQKNYPVERFVLQYGRAHVGLPSLAEVTSVEAAVVSKDGVYVEAADARTRVSLQGPEAGRFSEGGLRQVFTALVRQLNARGIYGVYILPDVTQIDLQTREDLRPAREGELRLHVWTSEVALVRTVAKGARLGGDRALSHPKHAGIIAASPLRGPLEPGTAGSLLEKTRLDDYLARLNRHPGRNVEAAISSTEEPGRVVLDYIINEEKPWFVFGQVSNTGTKATDRWRERFGLVHNQLLGRDDIASIDYVTSGISKSNAVFGSYSIAMWRPDRVRLRGYGSWGDFNAVGPDFPFASSSGATLLKGDRFAGESWLGGGEAVANVGSWRRVALDVTAGIAYQRVAVDNKSLRQRAQADLITPYVSARIERRAEVFGFSGNIGYETNVESIPTAKLQPLGRLDTRSGYDLLRGELTASTFLEPLLYGIGARNSWRRSTLAHELAINLRGQFAIGDNRLIPQKEQAIGGFFSVRGYPESVVAGDRAGSASAEYRFHLPRAFRPADQTDGTTAIADATPGRLFGRPFNYRPSRMYARPDWDLVARGFVDAGFTEVNSGRATRRRPEDRDHALLGTGVGLELQMLRNLNIRADVGWALERVRTNIRSTPYVKLPTDVPAGSSQVHLLVTVVW